MTFGHIPAPAAVFLDANTLVYHFTNHPTFGLACTQLVKRIEHQHLAGFTSTHVLSEIAHRLMTLEALDRLGWPPAGIAARLRKHHMEIPKLTLYVQAVAQIPLLGIQTVAITPPPGRGRDPREPAVRTPHRRRLGCRGHASPWSHPPRQ